MPAVDIILNFVHHGYALCCLLFRAHGKSGTWNIQIREKVILVMGITYGYSSLPLGLQHAHR